MSPVLRHFGRTRACHSRNWLRQRDRQLGIDDVRVYNVVGIPLAARGVLNPVIAGAAMAFGSVSVVSNSLLLRRWRPVQTDYDKPRRETAATRAALALD